MAYPLCIPTLLPPDRFYTEGGLQASTAMNATVTKLAQMQHAEKSANASHIYLRTAAATVSQPLVVGLQAAVSSGGVGRPSGTWLGTTNNGKGVIPSLTVNTTYRVALGETVSLVRNTPYFVVVEWQATTGTCSLVTSHLGLHNYVGYQSVLNGRLSFSSGAWGSAQLAGFGTPITMAIETDAENWSNRNVMLMPQVAIFPGNGYRQSDSMTINEHGNRIYLPACVLSSLWMATDVDSDSNQFRLYNDAGSVLVSASIDPTLRILNTYGGHEVPIPDTTLTEGWYRVSLLNTSSALNTAVYKNTYSAAQLNGRSMGNLCYSCERTQGNQTWVDDVNSLTLIGVGVKEFLGGSSASPASFNPFRSRVFT